MNRARMALTAAAAFFSVLTIAEASFAQRAHLPSTNWRQRDRRDALTESKGSSQHFALELRFGPYKPDVDSEFSGNGPYRYVYCTSVDDANNITQEDCGAQFYFGLEFDYLPIRIPYVGLVGPGFGWGFTTTSSKARLESNPNVAADQDLSFTIMPMHLSAVIRADELMRKTGFPVVPYGKFGVGFGYWRASTDAGTAVYEKDGESIKGHGLSWGLHFALGAMLSLDFLDPRTAARLDEATSINHIYLFGEWMHSPLSGLGSKPQLSVGTSTAVFGLAMDF